MSSLNSVRLIGNLGQNPEGRAMPSGGTAVNLSIATTEKWKDKQSGQQQERTEWHRVVFFGRIGEVCLEYLSKGDLVYIDGSIRTRKYTDKSGVERYSTEIIGQEMKMLIVKGRGERSQHSAGTRTGANGTRQSDPDGDFDDRIPF
jgi:single-strand DNA-binding protein